MPVIRVPATSANPGAGFGALGLARLHEACARAGLEAWTLRFRLSLATLLLLFGIAVLQAKPYPATIQGKVVGVHDGDTVTILEGTTQYKIRLDGIDAPELSQAFGKVAKAFASDFAFGKMAVVKASGMDRYGRYLGEVFVEGRSLNREILRAGLAWHYKQYSKDKSLAELEDYARMLRLGLWKDEKPVAPWDYRKRK